MRLNDAYAAEVARVALAPSANRHALSDTGYGNAVGDAKY